MGHANINVKSFRVLEHASPDEEQALRLICTVSRELVEGDSARTRLPRSWLKLFSILHVIIPYEQTNTSALSVSNDAKELSLFMMFDALAHTQSNMTVNQTFHSGSFRSN